MEIKTKFGVNDLIRHKYQTDIKKTVVLEVMYVDTCSSTAGTEIFYFCRPLAIEKIPKNYSDYSKGYDYLVVASTSAHGDYLKVREDEVVHISPFLKEVIKSNPHE